MTTTHSFDVGHACRYGLYESIFIYHLRYWVMHNKANNTNYHDGRTWTYNSTAAFQRLFPYFSFKQVRSIMDNLLQKGIVLKNSFNKNPYVHTSWYAFNDEKDFLPDYLPDNNAETQAEPICPTGPIEAPHRANRSAPQGQSITDNYQITTQVEEEEPPPPPLFRKREFKEEEKVPGAAGDCFSFDEREQRFYSEIIEYRELHPKKYPSAFYQDFFDHWTEPNPTKTKMLFESYGYFGLQRRLAKFWRQATMAERAEYWRIHYTVQEEREAAFNNKPVQLDCV